MVVYLTRKKGINMYSMLNEIDKYITFIRQKDSRTIEVKKLSKKYNKRAYKQFLYDHWNEYHLATLTYQIL